MLFVTIDAPDVPTAPTVTQVVRSLRDDPRADAFVFLSGGASKMSPEAKAKLLDLLAALGAIAADRSLVVGDGGTDAGLMAAAGEVRRRSTPTFRLLGIPPAPDVTRTNEHGRTPVEPNHTHVVAIRNDAWARDQRAHGWTPDQGHWGSETDAMYDIFGRLADGRPSVTIVANGGAITLEEVRRNMAQGRTMILVAGSGRATDAIVAALAGTVPSDPEVRKLLPAVKELDPGAKRQLFEVFPLERGPTGLTEVLRRHLGPAPAHADATPSP